MTTTLKVLGQSAPSAATLTTLYTVPIDTSTVVSTLVVANRSDTETTFRIAIRPAGAIVSDEHYIYYDLPIGGNDTFTATIGITLATTDVMSVYVGAATLSFNVYGQENS